MFFAATLLSIDLSRKNVRGSDVELQSCVWMSITAELVDRSEETHQKEDIGLCRRKKRSLRGGRKFRNRMLS